MKRAGTYRHKITGIFLLLAAMACMHHARAQSYSEYEVKAAYIYNFAKFVNWPEEAFRSGSSPIILGIIGDDPFGDILEKTTRGRTVNGRKWVIKRYSSIDEIDQCHILFVSADQKSNVRRILEKVKNMPTLTIGDQIEEFCQLGGIINFSGRQTKYGFQINKVTADSKKLRISSKLLALAKIIKPYGD